MACWHARAGGACAATGSAWPFAAVVVLFVLMIVADRERPRRPRLAAGSRRAERAAHFPGPRAAVESDAIAAPAGPTLDLSAVDPLAPRYKEWAERAAKYKTVEQPRALDAALRRRPPRPRRSRQGDEGHPDLRLRRPARRHRRDPHRHHPRRARGLFRRQGRRFSRVALQRLHFGSRHPPDPVVRRRLRPRHRQRRDDPGAGRLDGPVPPGARRVH